MIISGYTTPYELLKEEFRQKKEEGFRIPPDAEKKFALIDRNSPVDENAYEEIYSLLNGAPMREDFPFVEPNELDEIRNARPERKQRKFVLNLNDDELLDKYHGAWLGRSVGCALGKPVECRDWRKIRQYLIQHGDWPLTDYISGRKVENQVLDPWSERSQRENIAFMESDDDIRYTLIGLMLFERKGKEFTSRDIAELWSQTLPMNFVCTAERQALMNFNNHRFGWEFDKHYTSTFNNPYREWIGAQIRGDFFGFMAPGDPERAAEYAYRDACWTHVKNGIYGEMFFAALEAAAFVESDPAKLVETALGEIPANCRLSAAIHEALAEIPKYKNMEAFMEWHGKVYADMHCVHTINNAVLCIAALFFGGMNPDRSICESVTGGLDTDCNGATVGAIAGIVSGQRNFGGTLAARLHDTIRAEFCEFQEISMSDLAKRTLAVYRKL